MITIIKLDKSTKIKAPRFIVWFFLLLLTTTATLGILTASADPQSDIANEIADKQRQIEEIQRQIDQYQQQVAQTQSQKRTLESEIAKLNGQIGRINLEIRSLSLSIDRTNLEIGSTEQQILEANEKIEKHKGALAKFIRLAYENDRKTLTEVLLNNESLSDFFNNLNNLTSTQDNLEVAIDGIRSLREFLEQRQEELKDKQTDLQRLKQIQQVAQQNLGQSKKQKDKLLTETKGQESKFQELIVTSRRNIESIKAQVTYLIQNGVSADDAVKYGELAAISAGIRPAFLIAILEIESRLGQNVGTGNWEDDMYLCYRRLGTIYYPSKRAYYFQRAETEKRAFFAIVGKLGLNPDTVKVSREPSYGCGGAMGPAQFIPSTWLAYEKEVARITGHNPPSPWNIQDAFTASAIKLARGGADSKTRAGESAAARAYISGNSRCSSSTCNYYANAVLQKAASIEQDL